MSFYFKRYRSAWRSYWRFSFLIPMVLALYLVLAALVDTTLVVTREFLNYADDIPVAEASRPVGVRLLIDIVNDPTLLFMDRFALMQLQEQLEAAEAGIDVEGPDAVRRIVGKTLSLILVPGDRRLRIGYTGKDFQLGHVLVSFYSDRLLQRVAEGVTRLTPGELGNKTELQVAETIQVVRNRSLWSSDRWAPAGYILLISVAGVMLLVGILEFADPSFKSDRQIARYLNVPVLGSIPDARPLARILSEVDSSSETRSG